METAGHGPRRTNLRRRLLGGRPARRGHGRGGRDGGGRVGVVAQARPAAAAVAGRAAQDGVAQGGGGAGQPRRQGGRAASRHTLAAHQDHLQPAVLPHEHPRALRGPPPLVGALRGGRHPRRALRAHDRRQRAESLHRGQQRALQARRAAAARRVSPLGLRGGRPPRPRRLAQADGRVASRHGAPRGRRPHPTTPTTPPHPPSTKPPSHATHQPTPPTTPPPRPSCCEVPGCVPVASPEPFCRAAPRQAASHWPSRSPVPHTAHARSPRATTPLPQATASPPWRRR